MKASIVMKGDMPLVLIHSGKSGTDSHFFLYLPGCTVPLDLLEKYFQEMVAWVRRKDRETSDAK